MVIAVLGHCFLTGHALLLLTALVDFFNWLPKLNVRLASDNLRWRFPEQADCV